MLRLFTRYYNHKKVKYIIYIFIYTLLAFITFIKLNFARKLEAKGIKYQILAGSNVLSTNTIPSSDTMTYYTKSYDHNNWSTLTVISGSIKVYARTWTFKMYKTWKRSEHAIRIIKTRWRILLVSGTFVPVEKMVDNFFFS